MRKSRINPNLLFFSSIIFRSIFCRLSNIILNASTICCPTLGELPPILLITAFASPTFNDNINFFIDSNNTLYSSAILFIFFMSCVNFAIFSVNSFIFLSLSDGTSPEPGNSLLVESVAALLAINAFFSTINLAICLSLSINCADNLSITNNN